MSVIYFVWYFSIFYYIFSKILATNINSITSYSKIREEIKFMYVCMYVPYLQYCSKVWQFCSARNCDKLESLNKRALRIAFNDKVSCYQQLLHKSEGSTLYNRRIQNMLITIYKCLNCNSFPKYLKNMFTLRQSQYSFRKTNILSLYKPVTSTHGLNSFRYFASKNWNSLPNNVRSESTLSGFRRLLKAFTF